MRPTRPLRAAVLLFAAGTFAAGCSSDSSVSPEQELPAELGAVLSEMALPALAGLASTLSPVPTSGLSAPSTSGCSFIAASQSFACPPVSVNGLTVTRSFVLLDASGAAQSAFGKTTTAAVRTSTRLTGTLTASGGSLTVDQTQELTLSGLLTGVRVLNGTSEARVVSAGNGGTIAPFTATTKTTISNLMLPAARGIGQPAWPTSGTIALDMTTQLPAGGAPVTTRSLITFNGTSEVVVTFDKGGVLERCTIDLAGRAAPVCT